MDTVSDLAASLFYHSPEHALSGEYLYEEWDADLVQQVGAALSPAADGFRVDLQTSDFATCATLFTDTFEVRCRPSRGNPCASNPHASSIIIVCMRVHASDDEASSAH
jgi:hypothetical protein